jgi:hypothetical protein
MTVQVGNMEDPRELPGLAHFCEHMLFLGTAKYPEEGSYKHFLKEHGGGSNASTSAEATKYFFYVRHAFLEEALDRQVTEVGPVKVGERVLVDGCDDSLLPPPTQVCAVLRVAPVQYGFCWA